MRKESYAGSVKAEIADRIDDARHCRIASLSAILYAAGVITINDAGEQCLFLQTENAAAKRKCFTILEKAFNIEVGSDDGVLAGNGDDIARILGAVRAETKEGPVRAGGARMHPAITRSTCCKRAFLRDAFLCIGSMSDPHGDYHLEYVCHDAVYADQLMKLLSSFDIAAKTTQRGKTVVVYLKDGADIASLLNVIGAHKSLMAYEDLRIFKEMRAGVNRRVNCDTANIRKVVNASAAQVERIRLLQENGILETLDETLTQAAKIRMEYPEATLAQLAEMSEPPVSKSGMNHRLKRLMKIADEML